MLSNAGTNPATQSGLLGPHPGALPLGANKCSYQNIFLFLQSKKAVEKNKKITCKVLMREQIPQPKQGLAARTQGQSEGRKLSTLIRTFSDY